jgi:hypothetical protein
MMMEKEKEKRAPATIEVATLFAGRAPPLTFFVPLLR